MRILSLAFVPLFFCHEVCPCSSRRGFTPSYFRCLYSSTGSRGSSPSDSIKTSGVLYNTVRGVVGGASSRVRVPSVILSTLSLCVTSTSIVFVLTPLGSVAKVLPVPTVFPVMAILAQFGSKPSPQLTTLLSIFHFTAPV